MKRKTHKQTTNNTYHDDNKIKTADKASLKETESNRVYRLLTGVPLDRKIKKPRQQIVIFENKNLGIENGGLLNDIWAPN